MTEIQRAATGSGASNAFVMAADTPRELVAYTRHVLRGGYPPENVRRSRSGAGSDRPLCLWLVVILPPSSSSPPSWMVESVEAFGDRIRFNYRYNTEAVFVTLDSHPYLYWCKLPEVHHTVYQVELFDAHDEKVVFTRRCALHFHDYEDNPIVVDPDSAK
jgi:hypothetical protein